MNSEELANLSLTELNYRIQQLRTANNSLGQSQQSQISIRRQAEKEEQEFMRKMQEMLKPITARRHAAMELVQELDKKIKANDGDIDAISALIAQKLKEEAALDSLKEIERTISEICEAFDAYSAARIYQKEDTFFAVKAYMEGKNGVLNANDMSLGKTFEAALQIRILTELFEREYNRKPTILWLTKQSLIVSSLREFMTWNPVDPITPVLGNWPVFQRELVFQMGSQRGGVMIMNYEVPRTTPMIGAFEWDFVVIDEVHKLKGGANKSGPTAVWKLCRDICQRARFTIMLSGTPMVNEPEEMWAYLHIFDPKRFDSLKRFRQMFVDIRYINGATEEFINVDRLLKNALKGQVIRRRRDEVGIELPELTREIIVLEMTQSQKDLYEQMRKYFFVWLNEQEGKALSATAILAQLTRLRQINVWPAGVKIEDEDGNVNRLELEESSKIDEAMDKVEELVKTGEQIVIWSTFNEPLNEVMRRCRALSIPVGSITGANSANVGDVEKQFQQGEIKVLCMNIFMGEGLNLHKNPYRWPGGARFGIFLDLWWTPAKNEQSEARIHRPRDERGEYDSPPEPCTIYVLHNEDSVDSFIADKLEKKSAQFALIMESKELRPASEWKQILEGLL